MTTKLQRRQLLAASGAAASLYWAGSLPNVAAASSETARALRRDPRGILDLPDGFSYRVLSRAGERMSDGYNLPARPDAMGVFPGPSAGTLVLMRNHEVPGVRAWGPLRGDQAQPPEAYDPDAYGGVTRVVLDARTLEIQRTHLALCGTHWNCAGGLSPWGWLSCEEMFDARHGYVFLCSHTAERLQPAQRIPAYGHFRHEAATVDRATRVAYLSEDREDAALYRFVPTDPKQPFTGKLQALRIAGHPAFDTSGMKPHQTLAVDWVDVPEADPAEDNVRYQARDAGAARFARTEGLWLGGDVLFVCATTGGPIGRGQIFALHHREPAQLTLLAQTEDPSVLDMPDNVTVSPSGQVFVAEDGLEGNFIRHVAADGSIIDVARCAVSTSEFAGPCFSPDGGTLFANIQNDGLTLAIRGPFDRLTRGAAPAARGGTVAHSSRGFVGLGAGLAMLALAALSRRKRAHARQPERQ